MYKRLLIICVIAPVFSLAQNVGIGTKTPTSRLHVVDSSNNLLRLWLQAPTVATSETRLELTAGTNPLSALSISKYAPGTGGTIAGIPKDNLSLLGTAGNGGALLVSTGDGISPVLFAAGTAERMRITATGQVGIGTTAPGAAYNLHVHSNDPISSGDVSIGITNGFTTDANGRGARLRMNAYDLGIINNEATGKISLSTNANQRLVITSAGKIGINNLNPQHQLDIAAEGTANNAIKITHTGTQSAGIDIGMGNSPNNTGVFVRNNFNFVGPTSFNVGMYSIVGSGAPTLFSPNDNYGVVGESQNTASGVGVLGISNTASPGVFQAGVVGSNFSTSASAYGIIGFSSGSSGAGTVGVTSNATAGLLGYASFTSTGPAIKSTSFDGSAQIGLELENGALKVTGTKRTAFRHVAVAGNTSSNETTIPATTFANSPSDLLFVTPVWEGVYVNAPIGVYFSAGSWRIFRQDLQPMPLNAIFNVLVVKQ